MSFATAALLFQALDEVALKESHKVGVMTYFWGILRNLLQSGYFAVAKCYKWVKKGGKWKQGSVLFQTQSPRFEADKMKFEEVWYRLVELW